MTIPGAGNALVQPRFAANPPLGLRFDARSIGVVAVGFSLLSIGGQATLAENSLAGAVQSHWAGIFFPGWEFLITFAPIVALLGGLLSLWGGLSMWRGLPSGKVWVVAGLGLGILSDIGVAVGVAPFWPAIVASSLGVIALLGAYYVVVISRFMETPSGGGGAA
jgi:hypothetical protein